MAKKLKIALAQLNFKVGDIARNLQKHLKAAKEARDQLKADVIVFPELSITGYPPEDLLLRHAFLDEAHLALQTFIAEISEIYCVIGHPYTTSQGLYNSCSLIFNGAILGRYAKQFLPNYSVFDEYRYFIPGHAPSVVPIHGIPIGLVICEDLWMPGPIQQASVQGARLILSPNASPFEVHKHEDRVAILSKRAKTHAMPIVYVNLIGGQDEIVFDGGSMLVNEIGEVSHLTPFFKEQLQLVEIDISTAQTQIEKKTFQLPSQEEKIYQALMLGLSEYINKNHFPGVLIGLSGGIDSALTLAIAVDALGPNRVKAIIIPSCYTADFSVEDAILLSKNLGVNYEMISMMPMFKSTLESLAPLFSNQEPNVTQENIQARIRAILLMALSNQSGFLLLTTGNRSELAVGYCTLYGDMAGGFAVLKDVPKTLIYDLATYRNNLHKDIPDRIITRPPTAELAPNQKDEDTLPPYVILDQILELYLNQSKSLQDILTEGFDEKTVRYVIDLIHKSEYKRRQAAIGTRINYKSFGKDWRYPVTNGFKG